MEFFAALAPFGLIWLLIYLLFGNHNKKVFVSYHAAGDSKYKHLFKAWAGNKKFDFDFDDMSTDVSIKSEDEYYIKRKIQDRIKDCDIFLVIVGKDTHERNWVKREINMAKEFGKKIVAVKEKRVYPSPLELKSCGAVWITGVNYEKIKAAIEDDSD